MLLLKSTFPSRPPTYPGHPPCIAVPRSWPWESPRSSQGSHTTHLHTRYIQEVHVCVCLYVTWDWKNVMVMYMYMYISLYICIYIQRSWRKSNLWFFKIWMSSPWSHRPPSLSPASVPALHLRLVAVEPSQLAERSQSAEFLLCISKKNALKRLNLYMFVNMTIYMCCFLDMYMYRAWGF